MTERDTIDAFLSAMREHGIKITDEIIADGHIHRVHADGDRPNQKKAWYLLHLNGRPAGAFGHYKLLGGQNGIKWAANKHEPMSREQRRELAQQIKTAKAKREAEERARHAEAQALAVELWKLASPFQNHPYLERKAVKPHGARVGTWKNYYTDDDGQRRQYVVDNCLLIPVIDAGEIVSLQAIYPAKRAGKDKDFITGGRKRGCYFPIGQPQPDGDLVICEGFATGASIHEATGLPAICAFDAGNLELVAKTMRARLPRARIWIAADNDQWSDGNPGLRAAGAAAAAVGGRVAHPGFAADHPDQPTDFNDLARLAGMGAVAAYFRRGDQLPPPVQAPQPQSEQLPDAEPDDPMPPDESQPDDHADRAPFRSLGYRTADFKPAYYYMPKGLRTVVEVTSHTKAAMLNLAPLSYWEREFPRKTGFDEDAAATWLIQSCSARGIFEPARIRGRGAWWDDGRVVLHMGERLIIDGDEIPVDAIRSSYIYEQGPPLRVDIQNPLTSKEANRLVQLCEMLSWEKPIYGKLLAGWCFIAPICGALSWRPHIWINGSAGTGKSWVFDQILKRCLGDTALAVQSATTEAGLRQTLNADAIPVIFDEAEAEDRRGQDRIQNVLELMRQASSETGAAIIKGGANAQAKRYHIRSMFAFCSINSGLQFASDKTRVIVLTMQPPQAEAKERFAAIEKFHLETMTDDFVRRLHARAIRMVDVIRDNARTFAAAGAIHFGSQRLGDRVGPVLSGAFALHNDRRIDLEAAAKWVAAQDWGDDDTTAKSKETKDEFALLHTLMNHSLRVEATRGTVERNVSELIDINVNNTTDAGVSPEEADRALKRHGFKVTPDGYGLYISNTHNAIKRALTNTKWEKSWSATLKRLPGATATGAQKFASNMVARCVLVNLAVTAGDQE